MKGMTDKQWQEIINKYGVEGAFEVLLQEFHRHESLEQPSPNINVPTITTNHIEFVPVQSESPD